MNGLDWKPCDTAPARGRRWTALTWGGTYAVWILGERGGDHWGVSTPEDETYFACAWTMEAAMAVAEWHYDAHRSGNA